MQINANTPWNQKLERSSRSLWNNPVPTAGPSCSPEKDKNQIEKLSKSVKDRAEHLMIVDLLRNDIGSISKFGSVNVENAGSLIYTNGVDGFLIGGASLDIESFCKIIELVDYN